MSDASTNLFYDDDGSPVVTDFVSLPIPMVPAAPSTPMGWLLDLSKQMNDRDASLCALEDYYCGRHKLAFASEKFREAFGGLFRAFADNWCDLVVDAVEERLNVSGFRLGKNADGDTKAWSIWQANNLDAESQIAHTEALKLGSCNVLVWQGDDPRVPQITVEHPRESIVAVSAENRRKRLAALKRWVGDDGYGYAFLYLPDAIFKFRTRGMYRSSWQGVQWAGLEVPGERWPLPNPLGVVPMVPLVNKPTLLNRFGVSEIAHVIPLQDAINKLLSDMLVASEFAAFRQRYAIGWEVPQDPDTGQPYSDLKAAVSRLWAFEDKDVKVGEFTESNLGNFVQAVEMLVQHVASQTRTPPHYFYLSGQFPSGESIKSAETGLVAKAKRKMRHFGESWEEVVRLGFLVINDKGRSQVTDSETIWGDPESRIESEHIDASIKKLAAGVPRQQVWEDMGYSPQQIERFVALLQQLPEVLPNQAGAAGGAAAAGGSNASPAETPDGPGPAFTQPPAASEKPIKVG